MLTLKSFIAIALAGMAGVAPRACADVITFSTTASAMSASDSAGAIQFPPAVLEVPLFNSVLGTLTGISYTLQAQMALSGLILSVHEGGRFVNSNKSASTEFMGVTAYRYAGDLLYPAVIVTANRCAMPCPFTNDISTISRESVKPVPSFIGSTGAIKLPVNSTATWTLGQGGFPGCPSPPCEFKFANPFGGAAGKGQKVIWTLKWDYNYTPTP